MSEKTQTFELSPEGINAVRGYQSAATSVGRNDRLNLGLVLSMVDGTIGTAVFTTNEVKAAPVLLSREHQDKTERKRAIVINAGVANAYTGPEGLEDARVCAHELGKLLGTPVPEIYVASTGVIGRRFDVPVMLAGYPELIRRLSSEGGHDFARAILTTDTRPKEANIAFDLGGAKINIGACAKGAGMIMPDMATMLCCVVTDAHVTPRALHRALVDANERSFNRISVDGDTSTNDTVFLLANGAAGNLAIDVGTPSFDAFTQHLGALMEAMAIAIVKDGEGATKFIRIEVKNATSEAAAKAVGMSIANSPLVKTAFFGEDLNWGRIAMAVGKARTGMDVEKLDVYIQERLIAKDGRVASKEVLDATRVLIKKPEIDLVLDFKQGNAATRVYTCDLSYDYVRINAEYTT